MSESSIKLLVIIANREKEEKIILATKNLGVNFPHILMGKGTAPTELLSILGLGDSEKTLLLATVKEQSIPSIYHVLENTFHFNKPGQGIAFTIPISGAGGPISLNILSGNFNGEGE